MKKVFWTFLLAAVTAFGCSEAKDTNPKPAPGSPGNSKLKPATAGGGTTTPAGTTPAPKPVMNTP